jgi:hypothetical protein
VRGTGYIFRELMQVISYPKVLGNTIVQSTSR